MLTSMIDVTKDDMTTYYKNLVYSCQKTSSEVDKLTAKIVHVFLLYLRILTT